MSSHQESKVKFENGKIRVPDCPLIPFIEGDGIGPDIWRATQTVIDAAVAAAYQGRRRIAWLEILAGEKSQAADRRMASPGDSGCYRSTCSGY